MQEVHNERIEWLWGDDYHCVEAVYYHLFSFMEDQGLLLSCDKQDLFCLHQSIFASNK